MSICDYDAIVIGCGIAGLTAGLSLAQAGKKVVILEQHYLPGGWSQSFPFRHQMFCPGIHYIGELGPGERIRRLLEDLGIADDISFAELNPNGYDHAVSPGARFDFPKGTEALRERLECRYPREARNVHRYIATCGRFIREWEDADYFTNGAKDILMLPFKAPTIARFALFSFKQLLDHFFRDPELKWVLSTQCLDSGLPPSRVSGPFQAIVNWHYVNGGYYPKGGVKRIVSAYLNAFRRLGGTLKVRASVGNILIEEAPVRRAVGVRLSDGTVLRADKVVSSADAGTTYEKLVGIDSLSPFLRWRLKRTRYSASCGSLYMAFNAPPSHLGLDSGNVFYSGHLDLERAYREALAPTILDADRFPVLFLSADSAKDPQRGGKRGEYIATAFVPLSYSVFEPFSTGAHGSRQTEYKFAKARMGESMLRTVETLVPTLRNHLIDYDVGSPLTNTHYIEGRGGSMYGTEKSIEFVGPFAYRIETMFKDLYLCGHSTVAHGFIGAVISGRIAAAKVLGCSMDELPTGSRTDCANAA